MNKKEFNNKWEPYGVDLRRNQISDRYEIWINRCWMDWSDLTAFQNSIIKEENFDADYYYAFLLHVKDDFKQLQERITNEIANLFTWLADNTKSFTLRATSFDNVISCILRQYELWEQGFISWEQFAVKTALNIYQNHYLINGNKRVAFGTLMTISQGSFERYTDILKALEDE